MIARAAGRQKHGAGIASPVDDIADDVLADDHVAAGDLGLAIQRRHERTLPRVQTQHLGDAGALLLRDAIGRERRAEAEEGDWHEDTVLRMLTGERRGVMLASVEA